MRTVIHWLRWGAALNLLALAVGIVAVLPQIRARLTSTPAAAVTPHATAAPGQGMPQTLPLRTDTPVAGVPFPADTGVDPATRPVSETPRGIATTSLLAGRTTPTGVSLPTATHTPVITSMSPS